MSAPFSPTLQTTKHRNNLASNRAIRSDDRIHRGVLRLKPNMVLLLVEALHGCPIVDDGDNDIAVISNWLLLNDHIIAVIDACLDH